LIAAGPRRRVGVFFVLLLAITLLITTQVRTPDRRHIGWLGEAVMGVLAPVQAGMASIAETGTRWWSALNEIGQLRVDNARLRLEVERYKRELSAAQESTAENERLRRLLGFAPQANRPTVAARVISRDPSRWFTTLTVDRGLRSGLRPNDVVVTAQGLIGRLMEVYPGAARVLLISDPRSAIGVLVQRTREAAVAEGAGQPTLRLKYLSREVEVRPGDIIVTSGLGGTVPRGLRLGTVRAVVRPTGSLFQEADVVPDATLARLEEVLVLRSGPDR
jgi:rod shape-determining protein MreC